MSNNKKVDIQKNTWISVQEEAQSEKKSMGRKLRLIENFSGSLMQHALD